MPAPSFNEIATVILPPINAPGQAIGMVMLDSTSDGLVAHAGGGQALGTPITTKLSRFITVATTADSALLPAARAGMILTIRNDGANSMNVFPAANGDIINALSANTALALAAATTITYRCYTTGKWVTN